MSVLKGLRMFKIKRGEEGGTYFNFSFLLKSDKVQNRWKTRVLELKRSGNIQNKKKGHIFHYWKNLTKFRTGGTEVFL